MRDRVGIGLAAAHWNCCEDGFPGRTRRAERRHRIRRSPRNSNSCPGRETARWRGRRRRSAWLLRPRASESPTRFPRNPVGWRCEFRQLHPASSARTSGKLAVRNRSTAPASLKLAKLDGPVPGRNRVAVKLPSLVRQRDQHVAAARPDVQCLALRCDSSPPGPRGMVKFLVAVFEIGLARLDQACAPPCAGASPSLRRPPPTEAASATPSTRFPRRSSNRARSRLRNRAAVRRCSKCASHARRREATSSSAAFRRAGKPNRSLRWGVVHTAEAWLSPSRLVHEPAAHREQRGREVVEHAGRLERVHAPVRERRVDGSPGFGGGRAGSGPRLVQRHLLCPRRSQQHGEQRAGGPARRSERSARLTRVHPAVRASAALRQRLHRGEHVRERVVQAASAREPQRIGFAPVADHARRDQAFVAALRAARGGRRASGSVGCRAPAGSPGVMISTGIGKPRLDETPHVARERQRFFAQPAMPARSKTASDASSGASRPAPGDC